MSRLPRLLLGGAIPAADLAVRTAVFLPVAAGLAHLALRLGGGGPGIVAAALVALAAAALIPRETAAAPGGRQVLLAAACTLAAAAWVLVLYNARGAVIPGDDIAVPTFARTLSAGTPLSQAYPIGSSGHAYPPGYPLLLAPATAVLPPMAALALFKALTLASMALIPLAWGWMFHRLFRPTAGFGLVVAASYIAFFALDRTLVFALPFAGKNALLFALTVFPPATIAVLRLAERRLAWPATVLLLYGLMVVHYTMLHLATAFLGVLLLARLSLRRTSLESVLHVAAAGAAALALLLVFNTEAAADPRAGGFVLRPLQGIAQTLSLLFAPKPPYVIFLDADFGLWPSRFRGVALIAYAGLAATASRRAEGVGLAQAAAVGLGAFVVALGFAMGVLPAGVSLDFVRWFAWPLQALVMTAGLLGLLVHAARGAPLVRPAAIGLGSCLLALAGAVLPRDGRVESTAFRNAAAPAAELAQVARTLSSPHPNGCFLIGESSADPALLITVHRSRAWAFAEALSPCRYLNGSWVQPGAPGGRALQGAPGAPVLRALPAGADLYFIGRDETMRAYAAALGSQGMASRWTRIGAAPPDEGVWRRAPA